MDSHPGSPVSEKDIEFFLCSFVELTGVPKAKVVPATHREEMQREGAGFAGFAAGDLNQGPHDPDVVLHPRLQIAHHSALAQERRLGARQPPRERRPVALLSTHHSYSQPRNPPG